ncbi:MAG: phasin family protein [Rhodospirillales bacterium]
MSEFSTTFERLIALFRYRGMDLGALVPGQAKTMQALLAAGQRVAKDLEDLALRQASMMESSTRELMGSAQAITNPERFKKASEANLATLTKSADTTMRHLSELAELLMKYNHEVIGAMNSSVLASMGMDGGSRAADDEDGDAEPPRPAPKPAPKPVKRRIAKSGKK